MSILIILLLLLLLITKKRLISYGKIVKSVVWSKGMVFHVVLITSGLVPAP